MSYEERRPSPEQLDHLNVACFHQYPGVLVSPGFMSWYVRRPSMDWRLSAMAWSADKPVANVFLTAMTVALEPLPAARVGIIDTVMTHPEHRRQGLARRLLERVITANAGFDALILYTTPGSPGHRLYGKLGFQDRAVLSYWHGERKEFDAGAPEPAAREEPPSKTLAALRTVGDRYDAMPLWLADYWDWRRSDPQGVSTRAWLGGAGGTVTARRATMTEYGLRHILTDIVSPHRQWLAEVANGAGLHVEAPLLAVADDADTPLTEALDAAGLRRGSAEVAMLLPLAAALREGKPRKPWYILTESVIGV